MLKTSEPYLFREALLTDIDQIQIVRNSVHENKLSHPSVISNEANAEYITQRGKGWVCESDNRLVGFSIADLIDHNIWALFVHPEFEGKGIGKKLQELMLDWYFENTKHPVWLSTAPGTRAEIFYQKQGWKAIGMTKSGEAKFEMSLEQWTNRT